MLAPRSLHHPLDEAVAGYTREGYEVAGRTETTVELVKHELRNDLRVSLEIDASGFVQTRTSGSSFGPQPLPYWRPLVGLFTFFFVMTVVSFWDGFLLLLFCGACACRRTRRSCCGRWHPKTGNGPPG